MNPAVADLATVFGVSRQAIYKRIGREATPGPDKFERILIISHAADAFRDAGVARASSLLKMKVFEGRSLLDLAAAGQLRPSHIQLGIQVTDQGRWMLARDTDSMYIIDLTHYLDDKGRIAPERGPARKIADFLTAVVAHASDFDRSDDVPGPLCFKCRKRDRCVVDTGITEEDVVVWRCPACGTDGQISNWQGTFWDMSQGLPSN